MVGGVRDVYKWFLGYRKEICGLFWIIMLIISYVEFEEGIYSFLKYKLGLGMWGKMCFLVEGNVFVEKENCEGGWCNC